MQHDPLAAGGRRRPEHFAQVRGSPGQVPRAAGLVRVIWPFFLLAAVAGYLVRAAWPWPPMGATAIGAGFLTAAGALAWSVTIGRHRLQSFLKGARGEEWVARTLSFLPAPFRVYHGLPFQAARLGRTSDYDHVVVGPTGVFLVETKHWAGRISVRDGRVLYNNEEPDRPPLEQVKDAATALRRELREAVHPQLEVHPVLCFVDGHLPEGRAGTGGVMICTSHTLIDLLQEKPDQPLTKSVLDQTAYYLDRRGAR